MTPIRTQNAGLVPTITWRDYDRCDNKLEVCRRCKKHYRDHYIGVQQVGFYQTTDGYSYCDREYKFDYEQMTNLELVEHLAEKDAN